MTDSSDGNDPGNRPPLHVVKPEDQPTPPSKEKTYQDKVKAHFRVNDTDKLIVQILFENPICTPKQVAALLDISPARVREAIKKPGVRKMLEESKASVMDLVKRGQLTGMRKLMALTRSTDEWVALQASKILTAAVLAPAQKGVLDPLGNGMIYEVQIGPTGQVFQTVRIMGDPTAPQINPNRFPTPLEAMSEVIDAERGDPK